MGVIIKNVDGSVFCVVKTVQKMTQGYSRIERS